MCTNLQSVRRDDQGGRESASRSGWDRHLSLLERERIPPRHRRYYMQGAEAFVDSLKPIRVREVLAGQVAAFFVRYARERSLSAWQCRQMIEAVHFLLMNLAAAPAGRDLDWDDWLSGRMSVRSGAFNGDAALRATGESAISSEVFRTG